MKKYGFIGAGKMAGAIVKGLLKSVASAEDIACTCGNDDTGKILAQQTSIALIDNIGELLKSSKTVVLALIKPNKYTRCLPYVEHPWLKCKMKIYFPIDHFKLVKKNNANKGGICLLPLEEHSGES